jgi:branched-chain amino acid transport system ATP-binding protein
MNAPLLKVENMVKRYGGLTATDHLSLDVAPGKLLAIIGPNGAGKTTLLSQLSGAVSPDAGRILFDGQDVTAVPMHGRVRRGLARSYQITSIFKSFTVLHNVALAVQSRSGSSMRFWQPVAAERALQGEARAVIAEVGLEGLADSPASALSHGQQRQLELAIALATRPKLLLLDEPMAGMGREETLRMADLIERLKSRFTILLVEHDMDAVFRLADRIAVLVYGRVIAAGTVDEIRANQDVRRAYLGEEMPA